MESPKPEPQKVSSLFSLGNTVIEEDEYRITIKELSAFDYINARKLLKEDRDDDIAVDFALFAISMKKVEKKQEDGKYNLIVLPETIENVSDFINRIGMPLHLMKRFLKKSGEYNKLYKPAELEK